MKSSLILICHSFNLSFPLCGQQPNPCLTNLSLPYSEVWVLSRFLLLLLLTPSEPPMNNFPLSKQHGLVLMLQRAMGEGIVKSTNITKGRPGTFFPYMQSWSWNSIWLIQCWGGGFPGDLWRSLYLLVPKKTAGKVWSKLKCGRGVAKWWVSWGPKGGSKLTDLLPCTSFRQCLVIRGRGEGGVKYLGHRHHHYCWNQRLVPCFCDALVLRRTK